MSIERERVDSFGKLENGLRQASDWYRWGPTRFGSRSAPGDAHATKQSECRAWARCGQGGHPLITSFRLAPRAMAAASSASPRCRRRWNPRLLVVPPMYALPSGVTYDSDGVSAPTPASEIIR